MRKGSQWIKVLLIAVLAMAIMTPFIVHILAEENNIGRTADIFTVNGVSYSNFGDAVDALNNLPFDGSYNYVTMTIGSTEQGEEDIVVDISQAYSFYNSVRFISAEESTKLVFRRNQGYSGVLFTLNLVNEATTGEQSEICLYFDGVGDSSSFTKPTITIDGNVSNTPVFSGDGYVSLVGAEFIRQGRLCEEGSNVALEASDTTFIYLSDYTYGSLNYALEDAEDGETISLIIGIGGPDSAVDFCAPVTIEDKIVTIECYYEEAYINVSCSDEPAITIGEYGGIKFGNEEEVMGSLHFLGASGDFIQCDGFIDSYMNLDYEEGEVCVGLDGYYYSVNGYNNVKFYIDFYSPIDADIPDSGYYYYGDEFELQVLSHSGFSFMYWRSIYNETEYVDTSNYIVESSDKVKAEWYISDIEFSSDLQDEYEITYGDELVLSLDLLCPAVSSGEATPYYTWKLTVPGSNPRSYDSTSFSFTGMAAGTYSINCYCYVVGPDVDVSSDYVISEEATVTINKKDLTISPEDVVITYGDAAPTYSLQYDGFCFDDDSSVISFLPGISCDYTAGDDAGDYTISLQYSVAMPSSDNYNLIFEDGTLTVQKKVVEIPVPSQTTYTYTGEEIILDIDPGEYCYVIDDCWTSVGTVETLLCLNDPDNYMWPDETSEDITIYWTIEKQSVQVPVPTETTYVYTGSAIVLDVEIDDCITISGDEETNAGSYTATLSLLDPDSYQWADGTTADKQISWTITKAVVSFTSPQLTSFTYDGAEKTLQIASSNYYSVTDNTQTLAGSYTAIVSLLDPDNYQWSDNSSEDLEISWSISKAQVSIPSATTDVFTYDGNEKSIGIQETSYYTVTGTSGTNAGSYSAVISLKDTSNYEWSDGTTTNKTIGWSIEKATISFTEPGTKTFTYDGTEKTLQIASSNYYSVTGNVGTNAGNYTATVSLADSTNYSWSDGSTEDITVSWSIGKVSVTFTAPTTTTFTYTGSAFTLGIAQSSYYTVSGNTQTNSGSYTAVVSLADKNNYQWSDNTTADKEISWSISKAQISIPSATTDVFTYDGSEKNLGIQETNYYSVTGSSGTNAGSYSAVISLKDTNNYEWTDGTIANKTIGWAIEKATVSFTEPETKTFTYDGTEKTLQIASSNYYSVTGNVQTNAGSYTATVSLTDKDNYTWEDSSSDDRTISWSIGKKQIEFVTPAVTTFTYSSKTTYLEVAESTHYTVTGNEQINAGTYTAVVSLSDKNNCEWSDGTTQDKEISWTINKLTVEFSSPEVTSFSYSGTEQTLQIATSDYYTVTGNSATDSGSYKAVVSLTDKDNLQWSDNTNADKEINWSIGKITVQFTDPSETSFIYDAEEQGLGIESSNYYEIDGDLTAVNAGSYSVTISLTDKDNYTWSDGLTEDKTITWTITKAQVEIPTVTTNVFTYTGEEKDLGIELSDYYEVTGNTATNAGTYSAVISLNDTDNYEWTDKTTADKTIEWSIEKATISFTEPETKTFTYDGTEKTLQVASSNYYSVSGNIGTNAGNYTATVSLTDSSNYSWSDGSTEDITVSWSIGKASVTFTAPTTTTFTYTGSSVTLGVAQNSNYTVSGDTQTNSGSYTAVVSLKDKNNYQWSDNTTADKEISWSIAKAQVTVPSATTDVFTYDGNEKNIGIQETSYYTATGTSGTNAGSYSAVISLKDTSNYEWPDGTTTNKTIGWAIEKATVSFTEPEVKTFTYDGTAKTLQVASSNYYSVTGNVQTNAGSYTATVSLTDKDNYTWEDSSSDDRTISWSIGKITVQFTDPSETSFVYDTEEQSLGIESSNYYEIDGDLTAVNAGSYSVTISLTDKDNYTWSDGSTEDKTIPWTITKAQVEIPTVTTDVFTYTGEEKDLGIELSDYYEVTGNTATNAGTYSAVISLNDTDNYEWTDKTTADKTIEWSIEKIVVSFEYPQTTLFRYDGQEKSLDIEQSSYYSVTGNSAVEVGDYTTVVSLLDKNNYIWSDETTEDKSIGWSVFQNRIPLNIPSVTTFTYNGKTRTLDIYSNEYYEVTGNTATNAGVYTATVTLIDPYDYVWSDGSSDPVTISWSIEKAKVNFSEPTTKTFTYSGYEISLKIADNSNYTVSGNSNTNAGEYTATVSLKDKNNYCWSDGSSEPKTVSWSIEKAKLVISALSYTISYNSDAPTYQFSARGLKGNDDISSLDGTLYAVCSYSKGKPVGEYVISAMGCTSDNYDIEYVEGKLTVEKATLEKPVVSLIEFTYDGKSHNVTEKYEGQLDVVCESQTNCGSYTASLSIKDKTNYSWSDGTTEDISIEWKINKAKLVVTAADVTIHYGEQPGFSVTYSGFAQGDNTDSLSGSVSFDCSYEEIRKAGEYSVTPFGLSSDNYDIEFASGRLTVQKARYDMSGVSFSDARFEYDGKEHSIVITGTLPEGVTVTYTPGNTYTEVGTYEITAVFSCDTENYEAIENMKAVLRITNGFVGSEEYNRIVDEVLGTKSSHITNQQAKTIYENRISEFLDSAEQTDSIEELEELRDEFFMFLDGFVIDLKFVPLSVFKEQYYDGDVIETGFNLVGSMYYEYDVVFVVDYSIRYLHGNALTKGDTQFEVYCSELSTVIEIPEVLDKNYYGLRVYPEYDYNAKYTAGKTLPTLTGTAYDGSGNSVNGQFGWVGDGVIRAGKHNYTYKFIPEGETKAVYGTVELTAEKGNSTVESVKLADETVKLKYGDPLPELTCVSNVPGTISLDLGQVLTAGKKEYNFTFTPDSSDYNPCQGKVLIEVEKATLIIRARDLIIYQGDIPLFTFIYEGFVNVESSLLLKQPPVIKNIPTEIGTYTVVPEGVETENYVVVYEESKFVIKSNSYAAEIKDNSEEVVSNFKIDDNVNLQVKTITEGFNTAAFNRLLSESGFYMDKEELKYMYEMKITDDKGIARDIDTVILLNVPSDLKGYCLHLFTYDGEKFEQYINYEVEDGKIYLHLKGSTSVCISAVKEDDVIDYITQLITSTNIKSDEVWKIKVYYDLLSENGKQKLSTNVVAALSNLFTASSGKLSFNIGDNNITLIKGLENVITKELLDELVDQIDVSLISDTTQLSSTAKNKLSSQGMSVVKALEIALYKTVTRTVGNNENSLTELIDNNDINGNLRIYIPMTGDMSKYSNLNVAYVNEQGEIIILDSSVEEIDGQYYLVFDTDHFSTYAVIGTPISTVASRDRVAMSWIIILSFALAVCAVLVVGGVIKKKSEKGAD